MVTVFSFLAVLAIGMYVSVGVAAQKVRDNLGWKDHFWNRFWVEAIFAALFAISAILLSLAIRSGR